MPRHQRQENKHPRRIAIENGEKVYISDCKHHGKVEYLTSNGSCTLCNVVSNKKYREKKQKYDNNGLLPKGVKSIKFAAILHGDGHVTKVFATRSAANVAARKSWKKKYGSVPVGSDKDLGRTDYN
jgi:hypothetical protein